MSQFIKVFSKLLTNGPSHRWKDIAPSCTSMSKTYDICLVWTKEKFSLIIFTYSDFFWHKENRVGCSKISVYGCLFSEEFPTTICALRSHSVQEKYFLCRTYFISNTTSFRAVQCMAISELKCLFLYSNCFIVIKHKLLTFRKTVNQATFLPSLFKHVATFIWNFPRKNNTFE